MRTFHVGGPFVRCSSLTDLAGSLSIQRLRSLGVHTLTLNPRERIVGGFGIRIEPKEREGFHHVGGERRGDVDPAGAGVGDGKAEGVEVELAADAAAGEERRLGAVFAIAQDRRSEMGAMGAELMGAPGQGA